MQAFIVAVSGDWNLSELVNLHHFLKYLKYHVDVLLFSPALCCFVLLWSRYTLIYQREFIWGISWLLGYFIPPHMIIRTLLHNILRLVFKMIQSHISKIIKWSYIFYFAGALNESDLQREVRWTLTGQQIRCAKQVCQKGNNNISSQNKS